MSDLCYVGKFLRKRQAQEAQILMKYYIEEEMQEIRTALEDEVLTWSNVTTKKMFGCPCYKANNKLFTFLVTGGVVLTKLSEADRESLYSSFKTSPFQAGKKTVNNWPQITIKDRSELSKIIPFVEKSYNTAMNE